MILWPIGIQFAVEAQMYQYKVAKLHPKVHCVAFSKVRTGTSKLTMTKTSIWRSTGIA